MIGIGRGTDTLLERSYDIRVGNLQLIMGQ